METLRLFYEVSPYLILGFIFAGLLHVLIGEKQVRKHFSKGGVLATVKATAMGVPLPVCSCGVIPLAESLLKDGSSKSSTMAFLVSTPSTGIDSIFATYALLGPVYAIFRPIASFFSGILIGIVTFFQEKRDNSASGSNEPITKDVQPKKSLKQAFSYGFKVLPAEIAKWLLIGVIAGGFISTIIPDDFLIRFLNSPVLNYITILAISIPIYVCATGSIPIAATFLAKGMLPGAVLAFLIAGPATNTLTITFVLKRMGKKIAIIYLVSIVVISVILGVTFDFLILQTGMQSHLLTGHMKFLPLSIKIICAILLGLMLINSKWDITILLRKKNNLMNITVSDMSCQHCKVKIENTLQQLPEIKSIQVDLKKHIIAVDTKLNRNIVIKKIEEAGYNPQ